MPAKDPAAYMREYRKRQRESAEADGAAAAPFDFQDVDVELAIAEPPAGDPDAFAVTVRLDDAPRAVVSGETPVQERNRLRFPVYPGSRTVEPLTHLVLQGFPHHPNR